MKNIWNKIVALLLSVAPDKMLHFVAGLIVAAFVAVSFQIPGCIFFAFVAGVLKEVISGAIYKTPMDIKDVLATVIGGAVIQVFDLLHTWLL